MRAGSVLAGCLLAAAAPALAQSATGNAALVGEHGLWVRYRGDSTAVSWITPRAAAGSLEVLAGSRVSFQTTTPVDSVHTAVFRTPRDAVLTLRYGIAGDPLDRHETNIRQDDPARAPRVAWGAVDSLVVISDIHGEKDRMVAVLRNAGLVDAGGRWSGGRKQLVVLGDVFDRGPDVLGALWFLYRLEAEAQRAGGRLHVVLGNHEIMVMQGDLRFPGERDPQIASRYGVSFDQLFRPRESVLARWLIGRPAVLRIGDVLFAHGGVSTDYADWSVEEHLDTLRAYAREELFSRWADTTYTPAMDSATVQRRIDFLWGDRSVFWYRGYVQSDALAADLDRVLDRFGARLMVVGHTPLATITQRYAGSLIDVNTTPFAAEALLLVRTRRGWDRYRIREQGAPEPLGRTG